MWLGKSPFDKTEIITFYDNEFKQMSLLWLGKSNNSQTTREIRVPNDWVSHRQNKTIKSHSMTMNLKIPIVAR